MSSYEDDFADAMVRHELIGNPMRVAQFGELIAQLDEQAVLRRRDGGFFRTLFSRSSAKRAMQPIRKTDIDPALAHPSWWLEELPPEVAATFTAKERWAAADYMHRLTQAGIPEVGTDYDDPTFEDRFAAARQRLTLEYLRR